MCPFLPRTDSWSVNISEINYRMNNCGVDLWGITGMNNQPPPAGGFQPSGSQGFNPQQFHVRYYILCSQ